MMSVLLSRTNSTYSPGESVSGDVVIYAESKCRILDLTVNYCGISSVSFIVSEGEGKLRTCKKVEETDTHLDVLHPLVRSYRGMSIDRGIHTYPFSLTLPNLLPSSYKSPYGQIEYYIRVHFQTSEDTQNVCKIFFVQAYININMFVSCQSPKCSEVVRQCGIIFPKMFRLKVSVSRTAYVPGDMIPVLVEVVNESSQRLSYLFCTLVQITNVLVQMQAETVNRVTKKCLLTVAHKVAQTNSCKVYSWVCQMPSPPDLTATIAASTIVFVTYSIQVSAKIKHVAIPPETEIPIVFGIRAPLPSLTARQERSRRTGCIPPQLQRTESDEECEPSVTHPRRRVTVSAQSNALVTCTYARIFGTQLHNIATGLTRRVSVNLQSGLERFGAPAVDDA